MENQKKLGFKVNKKGLIEAIGKIDQALPGGNFSVILENGHKITAYLSGKMRMYKIKLVIGDKVKVEINPYDLTKGRIIYRL